MSQKEIIKTSLNQSVDQLSEANLNLAYEFINSLIEQEREEATTELLEIPDLIEDIELAKEDIEKGELTDWRDVRKDV
ncbi:hypothetical protein [Crocosphaera sp.]|uniref:hypothetical protein n=1 Tax=Crocosphaera sp. TaxID=2729996 RepID=UPI003F29EA65|nr:hypothetical protein [Crocosphaera sp.]